MPGEEIKQIGVRNTNLGLVDLTQANEADQQEKASDTTLQDLPNEILCKCIKRLSTPDQLSLSGANKFFYQLVNQDLPQFTRAIPQEDTKFGYSVFKALHTRFPALHTLLITGALSPEKMVSLAKQWDTLTQDLKIEIQKQAAYAAPYPKVVANPTTVIVPYVRNPHAELLEALHSVPSLAQTLRKQTPESGAALFQLFKSLSENPAGHSPITKLDLSGLRLSATEDEIWELIEVFKAACEAQHFDQLRVLDLSNIKFDIKDDDEEIAENKEGYRASITVEVMPEAEYVREPTQLTSETGGEALLESFLDNSLSKELRELRATRMCLEGDKLHSIADALEANRLSHLEILDLSQTLNSFYPFEAATAYHRFIRALIQNLPAGLRELHLPPAPVGQDISLEALIETFGAGKFKALTILNISRPNKPLLHPFRAFILPVLNKCPHLQEIHNSGNYLNDDLFSSFCNHLEKILRDLRLLDFSRPSGVDSFNQSIPPLIRLINALVGNDIVEAPSKIESLKLTQWPCTAEEIQELHTAIGESRLPNLKHLSLPYLEAIPDEKKQALFSMLKSREIDFHVHEKPYFDHID